MITPRWTAATEAAAQITRCELMTDNRPIPSPMRYTNRCESSLAKQKIDIISEYLWWLPDTDCSETVIDKRSRKPGRCASTCRLGSSAFQRRATRALLFRKCSTCLYIQVPFVIQVRTVSHRRRTTRHIPRPLKANYMLIRLLCVCRMKDRLQNCKQICFTVLLETSGKQTFDKT